MPSVALERTPELSVAMGGGGTGVGFVVGFVTVFAGVPTTERCVAIVGGSHD